MGRLWCARLAQSITLRRRPAAPTPGRATMSARGAGPTMAYKVRCPACGKSVRLPEGDAGLAVVCLACGTKFVAPPSSQVDEDGAAVVVPAAIVPAAAEAALPPAQAPATPPPHRPAWQLPAEPEPKRFSF